MVTPTMPHYYGQAEYPWQVDHFVYSVRPAVRRAIVFNPTDEYQPSVEVRMAAKRARDHKTIIQRDKARRHIALQVKKYLEMLKCEITPYLSYSPDIAPCDNDLFWSMWHCQAEQHFSNDDGVKNCIDSARQIAGQIFQRRHLSIAQIIRKRKQWIISIWMILQIHRHFQFLASIFIFKNKFSSSLNHFRMTQYIVHFTESFLLYLHHNTSIVFHE